ncbi:MurR/RpiR family transcriptional regulator [Luxibacter massiliensis]|uniref:MurR/RpiR family transcriptional regulator n=1 Tax=Luxibacter massiliensis TaxID=2219695 RepID=UPI000F0555B0|nr:MurR/RpiR family transcriptional regulator [Luxibacter massiliensis]
MDILERIHKLYPSLTRKQKGIADYLLDNPEDICYITLAQLSQQTGASELTILRFCQKMGCESFLKLKDNFREYTQWMVKHLSSSAYFVPEVDSKNITGKQELLKAICTEEASAAVEFFSTVDLESIISAVQMIRKSRHILVMAHDISKIPGEFLVFRLRLLYFDAELIDLADLTETQSRLQDLEEGDLVVFFAFPKYYYPLASIARKVIEKGIPILGITNNPSSPIAEYSSQLLLCQTSTRVFYNTLTLPMAMLNLLASYLVIDTVPDSDREEFMDTLSS